MAVNRKRTVNYDLPLDTHGVVGLQRCVRDGFTIIYAKLKQLQTQIDNIAAASNDSNSAHINFTDSNSEFGDDTP